MGALRNIGPYRIVAGLGKGGMAQVFLAMSETSGFRKLLVLKVLRDELETDEYVQMFAKEAQLAARLNHPHVVQTYAVGEDAGRHYMAMEYLEGQPLSVVMNKLASQGGIPLELHVRILCDALEGLHYAHGITDFEGRVLGLVHRDVSPQNVFVTYAGPCKVLDFGIAKISGSPMTETGVIKGKVAYIAPEQAMGVPIDGRADVFAVGVMLWEAIAKRRFVAKGVEDIAALTRRLEGKEPKIREVVPDAPSALADACDRALAHLPGERFETAADMRDALEAWLRSRPIPSAPRAIGALMEQHFSEDRARLRKLVECEIRDIDASGPILDIPTQTGSGKLAELPAPRNASREAPALDVQTVVPTASAKAATEPASGARTASRTARYFLPAAAVLGVLITVATMRAKTGDPAPVRPLSSMATVADATPAMATRRTVALTVEASPAGASLVLDGVPLASNPFSGPIAADDREHELRVEAEGYTPEVRKVSLGADLSIMLKLDKLSPPPAPSGSGHARPVGPARPRPPASSDTPSKPPEPRPLDWNDPWQQK